ncbi:MAG: sulfotransferase family protein [Myxococcales bacterium]
MAPPPEDLSGWLPARIAFRDGQAMVTWQPVGRTRFTEPFFTDALLTAMADPEVGSRRRQTPIDTLLARAAAPAGQATEPEVAGLIFHWSRCGSTLVSRMLAAASDEHLVLSEAPPVDFLLRSHLTVPEATRSWQVLHLRALVWALARATGRNRVFLKLESWHVRLWDLVREAFPEAPWTFVYRDPLEVLASHEKLAGAQMLPGALEPRLFGWELQEVLERPPEVHRAKVLASMGEAALEALAAGGGLLVDYGELPGAVEARLFDHFRIPRTAEISQRMAEVSRFHAKEPGQRFVADSEQRRREASPELRQASRAFAEPVHARLEAVRLGR